MTISTSKQEQLKAMTTDDLEARLSDLDRQYEEVREEYQGVSLELQERRRKSEVNK